jgi:hypothetical protein
MKIIIEINFLSEKNSIMLLRYFDLNDMLTYPIYLKNKADLKK